MASHHLLHLFSTAVHGMPVSLMVRSTCKATGYYDLCVATLVADPASSSTTDLRGLCVIALSAAAAHASATQAALMGNVIASSSAGCARRLFRACADKYGEAADALVGAREALAQREKYGAFRALFAVNDAAHSTAACRTLFRRYPAELARREMTLDRLCGIAVDIITLLRLP